MQGMKSGLLLLLPPLALAGNHWNVTLPGGSMRFQGLIMASSCRVEAGDRQMTVNLGQISSNRFHAVGEDSNPIPFAIHLQDCSTAVAKTFFEALHKNEKRRPGSHFLRRVAQQTRQKARRGALNRN